MRDSAVRGADPELWDDKGQRWTGPAWIKELSVMLMQGPA